jgi:L-glyceraldehyde 3-phosphate reductase
MGSIAFTPLAQGLLTNKYLNGIPSDSRAMQKKSLDRGRIADTLVEALRGLNAIAEARGQTLAQMALAWVLREGRVTSALIGASKPEQVVDCASAIQNLEFSEDELQRINTYATDRDLNLWAASSELA